MRIKKNEDLFDGPGEKEARCNYALAIVAYMIVLPDQGDTL
jgi:hypothetical protein